VSAVGPVLADVLARWRREAVPGTCRTGRYRMPYFTWGAGPVLAFVHGLADRAVSFAPVMARLTDSYRCVSYELPEGGRDGARVGHYRLADYARDLVALLDHLGADRAAVLGSSFGSTITLTALHDRPERFACAVLQGGFARRPVPRLQRGLAWLASYLPWRMQQLPTWRRMTARANRQAFAGTGEELWEFFAVNSGEPRTAAVGRRARTIAALDLRPILSQIRTPVLLVGGDMDTVIPRVLEEELLSGLPNVRRVEIPDCGHYPQYTHPTRLAVEVRAFLRENGYTSPVTVGASSPIRS
jgi:pimeloyl-ACP methyl ester carboxylesterase